jgi:hypothetical protein
LKKLFALKQIVVTAKNPGEPIQPGGGFPEGKFVFVERLIEKPKGPGEVLFHQLQDIRFQLPHGAPTTGARFGLYQNSVSLPNLLFFSVTDLIPGAKTPGKVQLSAVLASAAERFVQEGNVLALGVMSPNGGSIAISSVVTK